MFCQAFRSRNAIACGRDTDINEFSNTTTIDHNARGLNVTAHAIVLADEITRAAGVMKYSSSLFVCVLDHLDQYAVWVLNKGSEPVGPRLERVHQHMGPFASGIDYQLLNIFHHHAEVV